MSGLTIRSAAGTRPIAPAARRLDVVETAHGFAVADRASGELIAHAKMRAASRLARLLRVLEPTPEQLARLLDDERLVVTITLEYDGPCWRCGGQLEAGSRARFNGATRLIRHLRRCPASKRKAGGRT